MAEQKKTAFVLPEEAVSSTEPQTLEGFPGVFTPGVPVAVEDLGLTPAEAKDLLKEFPNLPLETTTAVPEKKDPLAVPELHYDPDKLEPGEPVPLAPIGSHIASAPEGFEWGMTREQMEAAAEAGGIRPEEASSPGESSAEDIRATMETQEM
jgi:hypothetical protein